MKATIPFCKLEREIEDLQLKLQAIGPMHPGSVSRQYQVCGRPGCRCMREKDPQRHGPYFKLAYVRRGHQVCRFVRADCVEQVTQRVAMYKTFRSLIDRWIDLSIQRGVEDFFTSGPAQKRLAVKRPRHVRPSKPNDAV